MMNETKLFVAMLLPFSDGSGSNKVLGVYSNKERAEARCYRVARSSFGYNQPTAVFALTLDGD